MAEADSSAIPEVVSTYCHEDCVWKIFHPYDDFEDTASAIAQFWRPLKAAFPDYEQRLAYVLGGEYEGRELVSSWGHVMGSFEDFWIGIPPSHGLCFLRFGFNAVIRDGKLAKAYILLDIIDLMRQVGLYPLRKMPGTAEQWPFPPCDTQATVNGCDLERGKKVMQIVYEMQMGLPSADEIKGKSEAESRHSPHWHENMNWYGPAGIGSSRRLRGFRDYHGGLFLTAFADRTGFPRDPDGPEDAPGHYIQVGDGNFAVTAGWPSLHATHTGGQWLGLPPSGREIDMRVADWYRIDENDKIIDNWVMIDIPHMLCQMGLDILDDMQFFVDPTIPRWPR